MNYGDPLWSTTVGFGVQNKISLKATGNITVLNFNNIVGITITVNGIVLSEGNQWTTSTDNATTAASMASAITTATATTLCTAQGVGAACVITANTPGTAGNTITIAASDYSWVSRSGTTLAGGQ